MRSHQAHFAPVALAICLVACATAPPPAPTTAAQAPTPSATASTPAAPPSATIAESPATVQPSGRGCRLFPLLREPTVARVSEAHLTSNGTKEDAVVTAKDDHDKVLFTTKVTALDAALCEHLPKVDHLLFLSRAADGTMAAQVYRPTAKEDLAKDAVTLCQSEVEAAKLFGDAAKARGTPGALQQAAGAITSQKYRDLIFDALRGEPQAKVTAIAAGIPTAVDADLPPGTACPLRTPTKR